jgi:hypothetical protein
VVELCKSTKLLRSANPMPSVPRDLFEDRKGAAERLDADPLPIIGVVVDVAWGGTSGDGGLARTGRLSWSFAWCADSLDQVSTGR